MATNCLFDVDIPFDCEDIQQGGIEPRVIIGNYADWKNATVTVDGTSNEITGITLASGGIEFYEIAVPKSSNILATEPLRVIDGVDGWDHTVDLRIQSISQPVREALAKVRFNKVVIIVPLLDGRAKIYGAGVDGTPEPVGVGMRLSDWQANPGDAATGGSLQVVAKTPDVDPPEIAPPHIIASSFDIDTLLTPTA